MEEDKGNITEISGELESGKEALLNVADTAQSILEMMAEAEPRTPEVEAVIVKVMQVQQAALKKLLPKPRPPRVIQRKNVVRVITGNPRTQS